MTTSDQVNEIAAALAKAQGAMKNAPLNKVNPHFRSKFADLASVREAVLPSLTANGIAVVQTLDAGAVLTRLLHTSGQWIESACPIPSAPDMQKMGSAITYARRYSLSAICGIAADEDDDANAASEPEAPKLDDAKYREWLGEMEAVAVEGYDALVKAVKDSSEDYRNKLKTDTKTWNALKTKAEKSAKAAA